MKTLLTTTAAALLFAGGAIAQTDTQQTGMSAQDWDTDQDMSVSQEEFGTGAGTQFGEYDANQDDALTRDEIEQAGVSLDDDQWSNMDANADDQLSRDEYTQGMFAQYDANQDQMWDESEFTSFDEEQGQMQGQTDQQN